MDNEFNYNHWYDESLTDEEVEWLDYIDYEMHEHNRDYYDIINDIY